jgi:hypothetical protein
MFVLCYAPSVPCFLSPFLLPSRYLSLCLHPLPLRCSLFCPFCVRFFVHLAQRSPLFSLYFLVSSDLFSAALFYFQTLISLLVRYTQTSCSLLSPRHSDLSSLFLFYFSLFSFTFAMFILCFAHFCYVSCPFCDPLSATFALLSVCF